MDPYKISIVPFSGKTTDHQSLQLFKADRDFWVLWSDFHGLSRNDPVKASTLRSLMAHYDIEFDVLFDAYDNRIEQLRDEAYNKDRSQVHSHTNAEAVSLWDELMAGNYRINPRSNTLESVNDTELTGYTGFTPNGWKIRT